MEGRIRCDVSPHEPMGIIILCSPGNMSVTGQCPSRVQTAPGEILAIRG